MKLKILFAAAAATLLAACGSDSTFSVTIPPLQPLPAGIDTTTTASGLKFADITVGTGAVAAAGKAVAVHYTGWLQSTGTGFDTSLGGQPLTFTLGHQDVIAGFDEGVTGMKVGGKRRLIIPPSLGYGSVDVKDPSTGQVVIPANSTLIFDVQLVIVQ